MLLNVNPSVLLQHPFILFRDFILGLEEGYVNQSAGIPGEVIIVINEDIIDSSLH